MASSLILKTEDQSMTNSQQMLQIAQPQATTPKKITKFSTTSANYSATTGNNNSSKLTSITFPSEKKIPNNSTETPINFKLQLNLLENFSTSTSSDQQLLNSQKEFNKLAIKQCDQHEEQNLENSDLNNQLTNLKKDGLIDIKMKWKDPGSEEEKASQSQSSQPKTSTSFLKRLLSKKFFIVSPSKQQNQQQQYYMQNLYTQSFNSSVVRNHAKHNFDQLQYLKEITTELDQVQRPQIEIPKPTHKKNFNTILLDLDETLVHCVEQIESSYCLNSIHDLEILPSPEDTPIKINLSLRPYLHEFLEDITKLYEVIVFTASERSYAEKVVNLIDPEQKLIDAVLCREHCIQINQSEFIKDLTCINRPQESILIIDNSLGAVKQFKQLIPIINFFGDEDDNQLKELLPYLKSLSNDSNLIQTNSKFFSWELFLKANSYNEYFQSIRNNYAKNTDFQL